MIVTSISEIYSLFILQINLMYIRHKSSGTYSLLINDDNLKFCKITFISLSCTFLYFYFVIKKISFVNKMKNLQECTNCIWLRMVRSLMLLCYLSCILFFMFNAVISFILQHHDLLILMVLKLHLSLKKNLHYIL